MVKILDGKKTSKEIKDEIKTKVNHLELNGKKLPHLAAVLVGEDGASLTYVSNKVISCKQVGFKSSLIKLPYETSEIELLENDTSYIKKIAQENFHMVKQGEKIFRVIDRKK